MSVDFSRQKQCVAVLTSGGDSQGMNAALRASVRMCLHSNARVFAVYWGYQGLVDGGSNIKEFFWNDVSNIIHRGGTIIGSARCQEFRTRDGRRRAAFNLVSRGITNLIVIGGDGSLTGADTLSKEWKSLLEELVVSNDISSQQAKDFSYLNIVGMVGSIDNDFCGTDMTIGADSALHRILESADSITTTAASHQRAFVLEVMGRNCGYLALQASISCSADWVCIPEWPLEDGWHEALCKKLLKNREGGSLCTIVVVAEGAQDVHGKPITSNEVKELLSDRLHLDTRVTVLGHVQRGGTPSAFDRLLASRFGAEAVVCVLELDENSDAYVMCLEGSMIVKKSLKECVDKCNAIKQAYANRQHEKVIELRGQSFQSNLEIYKNMTKFPTPIAGDKKSGYRFGLINIGAPAGGTNAANASYVRSALSEGHGVVAFEDGFKGMMENKVRHMTAVDVDGWTAQGGSGIGVSRATPGTDFQKIANAIHQNNISALLLVGGFEAFHSLLQLYEARQEFKEFQIPMVQIAATMSNNVPGSKISLGADTTLNVIVEACDRLRQSASSSENRVFIVETMGGKCGYLATMAGIAGAADTAYIFEEKTTLADLKNNIEHLKSKLKNAKSRRGLILRAENFNPNYSTEFLYNLYNEEGTGLFESRKCVLGHVQQGGRPSPFDRIMGTRYGIHAFKFLLKKLDAHKNANGVAPYIEDESACVLGLIRHALQFTPVVQLKNETDFINRLPGHSWWLNVRPLLKVLAHYHIAYQCEVSMNQ